MLTQDNRNNLVQLIRNDTGENANFFMLQIIGQVGLEELENERKLTSLLDGALQQIEMLNDVLETGEEFRRQVYNPNDGENEELGGMTDDDGYVTINTQNAPMLIEQSLWSLVTLVAFAKMKGLEVTSQAASINEVDTSADVVTQRYTPDVLEAMGLQASQEEPEAEEEPRAGQEEPRAGQEEPEAEEEPKPIEKPKFSNEEERSKPRLEMTSAIYKSLVSVTKKRGIEFLLDHLKEMYDLDVRASKTEVDARKIFTVSTLKSFAQGRTVMTAQLNKSVFDYEDLKYLGELTKVVIEAIKLTENTGLAEVSIFPEFYYETTKPSTIDTFQNSQRIMSALISFAHAMNKSNQLVKDLNLRVSNQEINMIYLNTIDTLVDDIDGQTPIANDKEMQLMKADRAVDNLSLFKNVIKLREDMSRQLLSRAKVRQFQSREKVIKPEESASIKNVTIRGF